MATIAAAAGLLLGAAASERIDSKARGKMSPAVCKPDVGMANDDFDAGISVQATLANLGQSGPLEVEARLSTSEGEWTRSERVTLEAGAEQSLSFFFAEPTVNATAIRCTMTVQPEA